MEHQIYPERHDDDGEYHAPVVVDAPNIIYLQFVDADFSEDWLEPSPEDERTFARERVNDSDLAYVPISLLDAAEAEVTALRAQLDAAQVAAGWWPVTERPAVTAQYQVALQSGNRRPTADHRAYYEDTGWVGPDVIFWRPIPPLPAPDAQEPTP